MAASPAAPNGEFAGPRPGNIGSPLESLLFLNDELTKGGCGGDGLGLLLTDFGSESLPREDDDDVDELFLSDDVPDIIDGLLELFKLFEFDNCFS